MSVPALGSNAHRKHAAALRAPFTTGNVTCSSDDINDFRSKVYATSYSIITIIGLLGNGFALWVLIRTTRKTTPFHIYMFNLAVSDILFVCMLPLRIHYYVNNGEWKLGDFLCRISSYALYVNLYCSIYFMTAMSVTRFIAIVFPVHNLRLVTLRGARLVCLGIWVFICAVSSPFLMGGQSTDPNTNKTKCFEPPLQIKKIARLIKLNYISLGVLFILPFLVILVCYAGMVRALVSRTNKKMTDTATKAIRMIFIVLLTFFVSFMPYHVQRTIHLHFLSREDASCDEKLYMQKWVVVTLCLAALNACFDPLLYFFSGEGFRQRLRSTFRSSSLNGGNLKQVRGSLARERESSTTEREQENAVDL